MPLFYIALAEHIEVYCLVVILVGAGFVKLFQKHIYSVFDPFFYFIVLTEAFCCSVMIFLAFYELAELTDLIYYFFSELALFVGILLFSSDKKVQNIAIAKDANLLKILFHLSALLFIALNLIVYTQRGIPLLSENRLETFNIGGGFGFISRVLDVLLIIIIYYLMDVLRIRKWKLLEWFVVVAVTLFQVLSGAKSAVLTIVFIAVLYTIYTGIDDRRIVEINKRLLKFFFLAVIGFLVIAKIQMSDVEIDGKSLGLLDQAALRFVNNGDAFVYAYADKLINYLDGKNPLAALFREYLSFFRLASIEMLPEHIGSQLVHLSYGSSSTFQTNAKHNIFGYVNFGYIGGIIYSFFLGLFIGSSRYKLLSIGNKKPVWGIFYILINLGFITSVSDWDNSSRAILNGLFVLLPLVLISKLILEGCGRHETKQVLRINKLTIR